VIVSVSESDSALAVSRTEAAASISSLLGDWVTVPDVEGTLEERSLEEGSPDWAPEVPAVSLEEGSERADRVVAAIWRKTKKNNWRA
jgi:hypothetical protein